MEENKIYLLALKEFDSTKKYSDDIPKCKRHKSEIACMIKPGDIFVTDKKLNEIGWWISAKYLYPFDEQRESVVSEINSDDSIYIPTVIFVPIDMARVSSCRTFYDLNKYYPKLNGSDEESFSKTERKYFPLIHIFYGKNFNINSSFPKTSFLSSLFYSWLDKKMLIGSQRPLVRGDLWDIEDSYKSGNLFDSFNTELSQQKSPKKPKQKRDSDVSSILSEGDKDDSSDSEIIDNGFEKFKNSISPTKLLYLILFKMFKGRIYAAIMMKIVVDLLTFMVPLILGQIIDFVEDYEDQPKHQGYVLCVVLFLLMFLKTLVTNKYYETMNVAGLYIRSTLTSVIYRKMTQLKYNQPDVPPTGDQINYLSGDCYKIQNAMTYINLVWSSPLQIICSIIYLWFIIGYSTLAGLGFLFLVLPINYFVAKRVVVLQTNILKLKDQRLKLVKEFLGSIKLVRLYAWEEALSKKIDLIRVQELKNHLKFKQLSCIFTIVWESSPVLMAVLSFSVYLLTHDSLDTKTAFVAINIFIILRFPLFNLPESINSAIRIKICLTRIANFLSLDELDTNLNKKINEASININNRRQAAVVIPRNSIFYYKPLDKSADDLTINTTPDINSLVGGFRIVIDNNSILIPKNSLTVIIGKVGSGKSSLISAINGQMEGLKTSKFGNVKKAVIKTDEKVAYAPQTAWIQNMTLRDNILFNCEYNKRKYDTVIEKCCLEEDIKLLTNGHETFIGEKGVNLSGGQRQRVNLARLVYSEPELALLDDPLSAVDVHVANDLFRNVISSETGVLKNATRILVTHKIELIEHADKIIFIDDGKIMFCGSFVEFSSTSYISNLREYLNKENTDEQDKNTTNNVVQALEPAEENAPDESNEGEQNAETIRTNAIRFKTFWNYMKSMKLFVLFVAVFALVINQGCGLANNFWLAKCLSDGINNSTKNTFLMGFGGFGVGQAVFSFVGNLVYEFGSFFAARSIHASILFSVLRAPLFYFDITPLGRIINLLSTDINAIDDVLPKTFFTLLLILISLLFVIGGIMVTVPPIVVFLVVLFVLYKLAQNVYVSNSRQIQRLEAVARAPVFSSYLETVQGISVIRAYKCIDRFVKKFEGLLDESISLYLYIILSNRWVSLRLEILGNVLVLAAALLCVSQSIFPIINGVTMSGGFVGFVLTNTTSILDFLNWYVRTRGEVENNIVSVDRINDAVATMPKEADWHNEQVDDIFDFDEGDISFENYSCKYRDELPLSLISINCSIKAGEKVGVVGRTGAGKSSLLLSLLRAVESSSGKIVIDGVNISEIGLYKLRNQVSIIPQEAFMFQGTLRENLDPLEQYSDEEIWKSLELSHLLNFVQNKDNEADGLNMFISEGGENLSAGQRQLACLARALLKRSKILVLDEATASVDTETDKLIHATIKNEFKNCTVIIVAHRLDTVIDSDKILVLSKGSILEFDTPANLLSNKHGHFYKMAKESNLL